MPNSNANPHPRGITKGVDGRVWFAEDDGASVYSVSTTGSFSAAYAIPTGTSTPFQMAVGSDGSAWTFENLNDKVVKILTGPGVATASATPGNGAATVNWTAQTGGSAITGFNVDALAGGTLVSSTPAVAGATNVTVGGLSNGTVYSFKVTAINAIGSSQPTASNLITVGMVESAVPTALANLFYMTAGPDSRAWFAEADANKLGAVMPGGIITEYAVTTPGSFPYGIAAGGDGNIWFTEQSAGKIGRSTPTGSMTEFTITTPSSLPEGIAAGSDGALWFVERGVNKIGRVSTGGIFSPETSIPTASSFAEFIAAGPDGAMWFTEKNANRIGRITTDGNFNVTEFVIPTVSSNPQGIVAGPDGALWFAESAGNKIGRLTTGGSFSEFSIPTAIALPRAITVGHDGALWFAEDNGNQIGRITLSGTISEYPVTTAASSPRGIAALSGQIWFTENLVNQIGHMPGGPGAPSALTAISGSGSVSVSWTPDPTDVGSANLKYTVTPFIGTTAQAATTVTGSPPATTTTVSGLTNGSAYTFRVTATNGVGDGPASAPSNSVTPEPGAGQFHPTAPTRILDTRPSGGGVVNIGPYSTPFGDGTIRNVQTSPNGIIPAGATAVVLNVTVTDTTLPSFLTIWPAGQQQPTVSSLNWVPSLTVPNLVTVQVGAGGQISVYNLHGQVDVIMDVAGYFSAPAGSSDGYYTPLSPARIMDTRPSAGGIVNVGPYSSPFGGGTVRNLTVAGAGVVPTLGAEAVVLNVTVTDTTMPSFLTIWPAGQQQPNSSNLNWSPGVTVPNRVTVKLGAGGQVSIYNLQGSADVIVDVAGWYSDATAAPGTGSQMIPLTPMRLLDTRGPPAAVSGGGPLGPGESRLVAVAGLGGVPAIATSRKPTAVVLNVTVTDTSAPSFLTVYPSDLGGPPLISDLNWVGGQTVPNMVVVKLGPDGNIRVYSPSGSVDVIVDVVAWYG